MQSALLRGAAAAGLVASLFAIACGDSETASSPASAAPASSSTSPTPAEPPDSNGAIDSGAPPKGDSGADSATTTKAFDPADLPACLAWLRADRDVTGKDAAFTWKSACGNHVAKPIKDYDATKGTIEKVAADPDFGGNASVRFFANDRTQGGGTGLDLAGVSNDVPFATTTYYFVVRPESLVAEHDSTILAPSGAFGPGHYVSFGAGDNPYALIVAGSAPGKAFSFYDPNEGTAATVANKTHLITVMLEGTSGWTYYDGELDATTSGGSAFARMSGATIGAFHSGSEPFQGRIAEILIFGESHDGATHGKMRKYLRDRYKLTF
jgi:hypothetical protein